MTATAGTEPRRKQATAVDRTAARRVGWLLAIAVLVILGPVVARPSAQPASRYALTGALVDRHTVDISGYHLGVDRAEYDGNLRSDKPPGQPLLAAPFYAVGRVVGFRPATYLRTSGDLGMWWVTLWSAVVPLAVLAVMMFSVVRRFAPRHALVVTVASIGPTLLLPYGVQLFGHVAAAAFGFAAWALVESARPGDRGRLAGAGALAATACSIEFHAAIVVVVVGLVVLIRHRARAWWFVAGAVPPAVVTALYEWAAFGRPWRLPYGYYAGVINGTSEGGYHLPSPADVARIFVSGNGLVLLTPITVLSVAAAVYGVRRPGPARVHAAVALGVFVSYVVLVAGWSGTALAEAPGPRYLVPALPFLAVPLAMVWDRVWRLAALAAVWGAFVMAGPTFTDINLGMGEPRLQGYLGHVRDHRFSPTVWSFAGGRFGIALYMLTATVAVAALIRAHCRYTNECSPLG